MPKRLELLAPAGDEVCLDAALGAGADAVYFGLDGGFNARARAKNLRADRLPEIMAKIHDCGRLGYLTVNTLVFDAELAEVARLVERAASAGVDAVIVQDLGVARFIKRLVPTLRLHASTQITCTDVAAVELLTELGASRITLGRELSLREIAGLALNSPVELEIFAHGALCIAYSGQCLTSEAIGGRSANRGACAQACRLPYDLVVDGKRRDLADVAYLLSPADLDASQRIAEILASGVHAIKIEGRLKNADYVAATTRLYRASVDAALGGRTEDASVLRELSAQAFSRGPSFGFLGGIDHQTLVDGTHCDHIGIEAGHCLGSTSEAGRQWLRLTSTVRLECGDGILVQGKRAGQGELGGRIWQIRQLGLSVDACEASDEVLVWLGPERPVTEDYQGRRVFRTSARAANHEFATMVTNQPEPLSLRARLKGALGERPLLRLSTADGRSVEVRLDQALEVARNRPLDRETVREKLARLGDTRYRLDELELDIPEGTILPISAINRARRGATAALERAAHRSHEIASAVSVTDEISGPVRACPPAGLFVTCRTREQAEAALAAGAQGIYLDVLALTGVGSILRDLRETSNASLGVALPRIRKPGEEKIDAYVRSLAPDAVLVRSLGSLAALGEIAASPSEGSAAAPIAWIGDFSLNVTNRWTALELLARPLAAFTPGYDLDAAQLLTLLQPRIAPYAEVVLHHPMPLFHMEHCVFAALLSDGHDHRDCGRPCERHVVSLLDRTGVELPLEADVGCRNTVFHGIAQSAADLICRLQEQGVRRFRLELVRETAAETAALVRAHSGLILGQLTPSQLRQQLSSLGIRLVRGSLRVVG